jgi:uncharacterized protein YecE (DUF72 family)
VGVPGPSRGELKPVRVGCSGWNYASWREAFYPRGLPARRWLEHYAQRFQTVEVNATFYRLPREQAVAHWVEQTPPGFVFAVKASRYLTHVRRLTDLGQGIERFYAPIEPLRAAGRLGPVLWQLPANFRRDDERLRGALEALPAGRHAFEFRHASWFAEPVMELLRAHRAALVIAQHPERPFQTEELTSDLTFLRFHYGARGRRGNYSDAELREWAAKIAQWRRSCEVFAYFNNDWEAFAPRNAARLMALVG